MRVVFQTIGVLTQYNWALPYFMVKQNNELKIMLITNMFSYLMGGFYYNQVRLKRMIPVITGSGVSLRLDKILEGFLPCPSSHLVHLNRVESKLTQKVLKTSIPKIFTFHGSLDPYHTKNLLGTCRMLKEVHRNVDAFVAVSTHSAETIETACNFKPIVIHNGVDIRIFNPFNISKSEARRKLSLPKSKRVILWVGRIAPSKGLSLLIKALPNIIKCQKNILVIIKGRSVNKKYLIKIKTLANRLRITDILKFDLRWTPNIWMLYYYRASDVYVHTSFSEGFSLSLLEAMASGTPVIGNNASSIPEAIGDKNLLFNSVEELSEKVLGILCDEKAAKMYGMKLFKRVLSRGFTSIAQAKKYLKLYEELAK